jgi:hypothetical protein
MQTNLHICAWRLIKDFANSEAKLNFLLVFVLIDEKIAAGGGKNQ